jgi:hypothetical protein
MGRLSKNGAKYRRAILLRDIALDMVQRNGTITQIADRGFAREQVRPSYRIFYADIETAECDDHHHLTISAVGFGKPFTCAWKPEGELDVRTFNRGPWEELFFS